MIKELIYASGSYYGSWCYYNYADFRTQKFLKELTPSEPITENRFQTIQFPIV